MSLRPTATQALGRGALFGLVMGAVVAIVLFVGGLGGLAFSAALVLGGVVGAVIGVIFGRAEGADVDDGGIWLVPGPASTYVAWPRIADLRTERHGWRIHITLYLDDTRSIRLRAPYDGRLLAGDPEFERKLFMLRHLWETHRYAPR